MQHYGSLWRIMHKFLIISIILLVSLFYGCHSSNAFNVEDEMMGGAKDVTSSPTETFWISLETTSRAAMKKSEDLIPIYYSLYYLPKNNEINITTIGGVSNSEVNIKNAALPTKVITMSEFKGVNIYRLFFKNDRKDKIKNFIKKKSGSIKTASLTFKVTSDPELMIHKKMTSYIKEKLFKKLSEKYIDQDFSVNGNFLVLKIYDFKYLNLKKTIEVKFDYLFTKLKSKKVDYAANLDSIEELISTSMNEGNYKNAQKFNDIYKNIVPNKVKYYNNAVTISLKLGNKMDALLTLIEEIQVLEDPEVYKDAITKIVRIYKSSLKRRNLRKVNKQLSKHYKKFVKGKLDKEKFIDILKNMAIEFSVE